jgi:hypothetical protein
MRIGNLAAVVGALLLMGPAVGVGMAEEKPAGPAVGVHSATNNSWRALSAVQATPLAAEEMDAVTGKNTAVLTTNIFAFLHMFGTMLVDPNTGTSILFFSFGFPPNPS